MSEKAIDDERWIGPIVYSENYCAHLSPSIDKACVAKEELKKCYFPHTIQDLVTNMLS
jgi:hypothetical protein